MCCGFNVKWTPYTHLYKHLVLETENLPEEAEHLGQGFEEISSLAPSSICSLLPDCEHNTSSAMSSPTMTGRSSGHYKLK